MKVLIDTSIWSFAFRREKTLAKNEEVILLRELHELISETRAIIIGVAKKR